MRQKRRIPVCRISAVPLGPLQQPRRHYIYTVFLGIGSNTETQAHHQSQTDQLFYRILLAAFGIILNRVLS